MTRYERGQVSPLADTLDWLLAASGLEASVQLVPRHTALDAELRQAMALTVDQRLNRMASPMYWVIDRLLSHHVPFVVEGGSAATLHGVPGQPVWQAIAIARDVTTVREFYLASRAFGLDPVDRQGLRRGGIHPADLILDEDCPTFDVSGMLMEVRRPTDPDTVDCVDVFDEAVLLRGLDALCADPFGHGVDAMAVRRLQALRIPEALRLQSPVLSCSDRVDVTR